MTTPTITTPPTAPSRDAPTTFRSRMDAFLAWMVTFASELTTLISWIETQISAISGASDSADAAAESAGIAQASANFKGAWGDLSGALNVPATVSHLGSIWILESNLADVTAKTPGTDPEWTELYDLAGAVTADANGNVSLAQELQAKAYIGTNVALSGTTPTINCNAGNSFSISTTGNTTFTLDASGIDLATNEEWTAKLQVTAGGTHTNSYTNAGAGTVKYLGGTQPDAPASGETDILTITYDGTDFTVLLAGDAIA